MSAQAKPSTTAPWTRVASRLLLFLALATAIGWALRRSATSLDNRTQPAGFLRGAVQGAMMPLALPNLLVGNDVPIYAAYNTGLSYKLGYTVGVNGCGLLFFGLLFWRLHRWKASQSKSPAS